VVAPAKRKLLPGEGALVRAKKVNSIIDGIKTMANQHIGGNFNDFLAEEGMLEEVTAAAMKRVLDWQIAQGMKAQASPSTPPQAHQNRRCES
jgi:hypothetical protein